MLETRKYLAQKLIGCGFNLHPDSDFKTGLAHLIIEKLDIPNPGDLLCGSFDIDTKTSSTTKCKCGREKWYHPKAT